MIAGDGIEGCAQGRDDLPELRVFLRRAAFDEVAGVEHEVGLRLQGVDLSDAAGERLRSVDPPAGRRPHRIDVRVADLDDDHAAVSTPGCGVSAR